MQQNKPKDKQDIILAVFVAACFITVMNLCFIIDTQRQIKELRHDIFEYFDRYTLPLD